MKIAVASQSKKEEAKISEQAGRSPFYLIFDERGSLLETLKNPFSRGGGGAGFGVAKMLADREVDLVVAVEFGPKMTAALKERGLRAVEAAGTVREGLAAAGI